MVCRRFVHDYFVKFLPIIKKKNSGVNQWAYFGKLPFYLIRFFSFFSIFSFFFLLFFFLPGRAGFRIAHLQFRADISPLQFRFCVLRGESMKLRSHKNDLFSRSSFCIVGGFISLNIE